MAEAAISGVTTVVDKLESCFKKCFERADLVSDNKKTLNDLLVKHRNTLETIVEGESTWTQDRDVQRRLGEYKTELEANVRDLESRKNDVDNANCMSRVKRMRSVMREYQTLVNEAREYYTNLRPALQRNADSEGTGERNTDVGYAVRDRYVRGSNVPPNPPRLTLDYSSTNTYEGQLKAEVLSSLESSDRIVGVMALGLGGVGKTCALRGLANDKDMKEKFPDGVLFIQLGNDSVLSDMIMGIALIVERTGGSLLARTIRGLKTVKEASDRAGGWFKTRKCLFLVDDIWEVNGITPQELRNMGMMLSDGSLLVFTSRSKGFLDGVDRGVLFKERETQGELSKRMLMNHADCKYSELSSGDKEAVKGILGICQGLPLALGIAGATVWKKYYGGESESSENAWSNYYHDLISKDEEDIVTKEDGLYGPLSRIVDRSIKVLDSRSGYGRRFAVLFRGFCVLQKQQNVGGQMLQRLWSLDNVRDTREIAEMFESVSLLRMQRMKGNEFYVQVHDLVLDIAQKMVSGSETVEWFKVLLKNYISRERSGTAAATEISATKVDRVRFTPWWKLEDDGFIHDNLCRILQGAEETSELVWLLERAQWVVMRLQSSGIRGVERDLDVGIQVAEKNGSEKGELIHYLRLIGSAARLSCVAVSENKSEAWYQMYGRVLWYTEQCKRTKVFTSDIEKHAPRPWVRPSVGFLTEAGGPELEVLHVDRCRRILCVSHGGNIVRVLWMGFDDDVFVTEYDRRNGRIKAIRLDAERSNGLPSSALKQNSVLSVSRGCTCGAFSVNQKWLITGHDDGRVLVWNLVSGNKLEHSFRCYVPVLRRLLRWMCSSFGERDVVSCVGISGDGAVAACGSRYGSVYVWNTRATGGVRDVFQAVKVGGVVGDVDMSFDGKRVVCRSERSKGDTIHVWDRDVGGAMAVPPGMQTGEVQCTTISRDGKRVVSGSFDGTVRIWNVDSTAGAVRSMKGHGWWVRHVALSADGTRIVSASVDETACVWDAETGAMIGQPLEVGYTGGVSISPDGKQVAAWSSIGDTVQVFDAEKMSASLRPERFTGRVLCVAYDGHGTRVVSGCDDGRVRVWDRTNGQLIAEAQERHADAVSCVAVSADGGRIVSGGWDGSVRVWDANCDAVAPSLEKVGGKQLRAIESVAVNNDGTRVVFSTLGTGVFVWDVGSGGVTTVTRDDGYSRVAMSCDGARVAFTSGKDHDDEVTVWDVHARQAVASPLTGHTELITDVVFSGDGTRVLFASRDGTVRVWDADSGTAIGNPLVHGSTVVHVQSNMDGSCVVSYGERGYGRMWHVRRGECVITSADADWISTLHRHGLVPYCISRKFLRNITRCAGTDTEKLLASADTRVVLVGDLYFSERHGAKFWPFATIVT